MLVKILKNIVTYITVIIAIGYLVYSMINDQYGDYEYMILSLLILISTTFVLEMLDDKRKWKNIEDNLHNAIGSISDCQITTFNNTKDWVAKIEELTKDGEHKVDSAALDKTTRSKAKPQYSSIWRYLETCSHEERIKFRHILRIRKNNFQNILDRIISGSAKKNSYFAYYELPTVFSFPTFGIIDERYIITRSPYQQGETPCYMIIDNKLIANYFMRYFEELWRESNKIESVYILKNLFSTYKNEFSDKEIKQIETKIDKITKAGIMDDI